jgi:transcription initiation factor IIE alpha subunit
MNTNNHVDTLYNLDKLIKKLTIQTPEEKIKILRQKTFYHITYWKARKKMQRERKRMIRRLKKELEKSKF